MQDYSKEPMLEMYIFETTQQLEQLEYVIIACEKSNHYSSDSINEIFYVNTKVRNLTEGILVMVEHEAKSFCLFADELMGQQQVVVKALPNYIKKKRKINGLGGCTLLGDGNISLILDVGGLII